MSSGLSLVEPLPQALVGEEAVRGMLPGLSEGHLSEDVAEPEKEWTSSREKLQHCRSRKCVLVGEFEAGIVGVVLYGALR
jgi:hypothetical protein